MGVKGTPGGWKPASRAELGCILACWPWPSTAEAEGSRGLRVPQHSRPCHGRSEASGRGGGSQACSQARPTAHQQVWACPRRRRPGAWVCQTALWAVRGNEEELGPSGDGGGEGTPGSGLWGQFHLAPSAPCLSQRSLQGSLLLAPTLHTHSGPVPGPKAKHEGPGSPGRHPTPQSTPVHFASEPPVCSQVCWAAFDLFREVTALSLSLPLRRSSWGTLPPLEEPWLSLGHLSAHLTLTVTL